MLLGSAGGYRTGVTMKGRCLVCDYWESARRPALWMYSTWLELATKYRRATLGLLWAMIPPALYAFGVGFFFSHLQGWEPQIYVPHVGFGYVVFRFITVSLSEATTACVAHSSFILDGRTRLTDYVLRVLAKATFHLVMAAPVIVGLTLISAEATLLGALLVLVGALCIAINLMWMAAAFSVVGSRFSDVGELIGTAIMVAFLFTPILWSADQVPADTLRGIVARANPLFHMVEVVRAPLVGRVVEPFTYWYLVALGVIGWVVSSLIYRRYAHYVPLWV